MTPADQVRVPTGDRVAHDMIIRGVDLVVAAVGLVVAAPVLVCLAGAIRWRLGSPVLFRQERAGQHGRPFVVVKFRTMTDGRGADGQLLPDEVRLTRFGRFLRATSLDELPQLWNIARGDMGLVGPRPLPTRYVPRYDSTQRRRLDVRPGLTGWAQVHGRNAIDWPTKLAHDVWYVDHRSLRLDARILLLTARTVLRRHGISSTDHATMTEFMGASTELGA